MYSNLTVSVVVLRRPPSNPPLPVSAPPPGFFGDLLSLVCQSFSMVDMVLLLHGNAQPLSRIQPQLNAFFTQHYLQGRPATDANITVSAPGGGPGWGAQVGGPGEAAWGGGPGRGARGPCHSARNLYLDPARIIPTCALASALTLSNRGSSAKDCTRFLFNNIRWGAENISGNITDGCHELPYISTR